MNTARRSRRSREVRNRFVTPWMMTLTILGLAGAVALALAVGDKKQAGSNPSGAASAATGAVNSMGAPYVKTPGEGTGNAAAAGVEVTGAQWELGTVPLNVAVTPTWTLRNAGPDTVTIGEPSPEILEGCCPGPFVLGAHYLAPGSSTTLSFELSMHAGMDGAHDILVHVPLTADGSDETLTLEVTGDFQSSAPPLPAT